jgi:hypothetical protein
MRGNDDHLAPFADCQLAGIDRRLVSARPGWVKAREWAESTYHAAHTTLTVRPVDV